MLNDFFDFFFSKSALQNYTSEIFGILITVILVNWLLNEREKFKNRIILQLGNAELLTLINDFLLQVVPASFSFKTNKTYYFGKLYRAEVNTYKKIPVNAILKEWEEAGTITTWQNLDKAVHQYKISLNEFLSAYRKILPTRIKLDIYELLYVIDEHFALHTTSVTDDTSLKSSSYLLPELIQISFELQNRIIKKSNPKSRSVRKSKEYLN